jgi:hypothetical protein
MNFHIFEWKRGITKARLEVWGKSNLLNLQPQASSLPPLRCPLEFLILPTL